MDACTAKKVGDSAGPAPPKRWWDFEGATLPAPGGRVRVPLHDMSSTLNIATDASALDTSGKAPAMCTMELADAGSEAL